MKETKDSDNPQDLVVHRTITKKFNKKGNERKSNNETMHIFDYTWK